MANSKHDKARTNKILSIRAKARRTTIEEMAKGPCCTCGKPAHTLGMYRTDEGGKAVQGCVDAHHTLAHHVGEAAFWLYRPAAQEIRRNDPALSL